MFTFRAEYHSGDYVVYSAGAYRVDSVQSSTQPINLRGESSATAVLMPNAPVSSFDYKTLQMFEKNNDAPDSGYALHVGGAQPFRCVYVMNAAGKTIDTVH